MDAIERFRDRRTLIQAMKRQRIVNGNEAVAEALADAGTLASFAGALS